MKKWGNRELSHLSITHIPKLLCGRVEILTYSVWLFCLQLGFAGEKGRGGGWGADNFIRAFPLLAATFGKYVNLLSLSADICNVKIEIDTSQFVESSKYKHACKISDLTESI